MERTECHDGNHESLSDKKTDLPSRGLKKVRKLTTKQLRKFNGLENISEAEAFDIADGLYDLSVLFYDLYAKIKIIK